MKTPEETQPLSTQGSSEDREENLGGTTNLSLDQLKEEGGVNDSDTDNPDDIENPDDLHEIQADDDLSEPDAEDVQPINGEVNEDADNEAL